jgi:hypothetical protein
MFGAYPKATRPLTALPRRGVGVVFAVATAAGFGVGSGVLRADAKAIGVSAGLAVATGVLKSTVVAVGTCSGLGVATGVLRADARSVVASAGLGVATGVLRADARSVAASAGLGVATGVLRATTVSVGISAGLGTAHGVLSALVFSVGSAAGSSSVSGVDSPGSVAHAAGFGQAFGVSYAFYLDAERVCVPQELRVAVVLGEPDLNVEVAYVLAEDKTHVIDFEDRVAIAPYVERVYEIGEEDRDSELENRKRTC